MNVAHLLRLDYTIEHVEQNGPPDEMGDPTEVVTTSTFKGYAWQSRREDETSNTAVAFEEWRLALHRSAAGEVDAGDRVEIDGTTFEVYGPPWIARNARTTAIEYVELTLRRTS